MSALIEGGVLCVHQDDYTATVITDDMDLGTVCPICGRDTLNRDSGIVDLTGTTLARQYFCEDQTCGREIVAVHEDLARRLGVWL